MVFLILDLTDKGDGPREEAELAALRTFRDLAVGEAFVFARDEATVPTLFEKCGEDRFCPAGGGFVYPAKPEAMNAVVLPAPAPRFVEARFAIDGEGVGYPGWYDPSDRWNGWAKPLFSEATINDIVASGMLGDDYTIDIEGEILTLVDLAYEDDPDEGKTVIPAKRIREAGETPLFDLGWIGWCWLECREGNGE